MLQSKLYSKGLIRINRTDGFNDWSSQLDTVKKN